MFKKLFGLKKKKSVESLAKPMSEIQREEQGYVSLGRSIFPVVKSVDDPRIKMSQHNNPLITEPLAKGVVVCFAMDMGDQFTLMSDSHLKQFGFDHEIVKNTAIRNLVDKVNERCTISVQDFTEALPQSKPFFKLEMDANYPPSMMLLDDFWETNAPEIVKSDTIAVSIPAKNLLFFSDLKTMESFRTMRVLAARMYDASVEDGIQITKNTYIRKNGKWFYFQDTNEQMEMLYS